MLARRRVARVCGSLLLASARLKSSGVAKDPGDGGTAAAGTPGNSRDARGSDEEDENPVDVLKRLQERMRPEPGSGAPRPHATKTKFFEDDDDDGGAHGRKQGLTDIPSYRTPRPKNAKPGGDGVKLEASPFLKKLTAMEAQTEKKGFPTYDEASERRRKHIEEKIKEERGNMLVFRDVGMDLDKPILSRDVFLILKYFRYGWEFALDNELERLLRYFNEHAMDELKIVQDSKLMRGPATLSKKRKSIPPPRSAPHSGSSSGSSDAAPSASAADDAAVHNKMEFQLDSHFPSDLRAANLMQYTRTPFHADSYNVLRQYLRRPTAAQTNLAPFFLTAVSATSSAGSTTALPATALTPEEIRKSMLGFAFSNADDTQFTKFSAGWVRRPAVVILTQMGQKFGAQAELEWRRLCCECLYPQLLPHVPPGADAGPAASPAQAHAGGGSSSSSSAGGSNGAIDVIALKSMDSHLNFSTVQRMYVKQYARYYENKSDVVVPSPALHASGAQTVNNVNTNNEFSELYNLWVVSSTFVGVRLLQPFYKVVGARNYFFPHVFLVDGDGVIRWMSGGLPDAYERSYFPSLLKQLETEYYQQRH